jgi:hypothetical protein
MMEFFCTARLLATVALKMILIVLGLMKTAFKAFSETDLSETSPSEID